MIGFTDNVRPFIGELMKEGNFIRLVHPEDLHLDIDFLVDTAYKVRACINTFLANYSRKIYSEETFMLPVDHRTTQTVVINYHDE